MKNVLFLLIVCSCANLTESGAKVGYVETSGKGIEVMELADKIAAQHDCKFVGFIDAKTSKFPGSYSVHENEIHSALRNRAAKIGANVVVANFYQKPANGVGLLCPEEFVHEHQ
jgi:hypothetical protein